MGLAAAQEPLPGIWDAAFLRELSFPELAKSLDDVQKRLRSLGPLEKIYLIWMVGASCDGCSVAATGATHPRVEHLLAGIIPGLPRVELIHTVVSTEVGPEWTHNLFMAERGELDAPYVITWEGSIMDESIAGDGYWMGLGEDPQTGRQITSLEWLDRLSPGAAAVIAIGTCASWGGIPAAKGNPTNAMGVMDYLGKDFRSAFGVPVVNIPGCSPIGVRTIRSSAPGVLNAVRAVSTAARNAACGSSPR